jgi:hypothetical protein
MNYYIKQARSQEVAYYIGKTRKNPLTERGNPTNRTITEWINEYGKIAWNVLAIIPECELHYEYGETYLINCFKEKFSNFKLLNVANPHSGAINYDKKSELIIDRLKKIIYIN